ncbi:Mut7-C ubiquitin/RNAse domain-containing protein [Nocardia amamiensis]|uniref:Mut7-C ubiquitin/RNAse domain-containing protein n=1 Tax=Nocardia amamiensis TaxID=404578 RepID=A0ABS0CXM7_9NOCA|nr:Mut7-C RNAse domain-containing protein [Nocardia amamiensis]MBF6301354.1 Mut7-C ubiquitin/RNAse domain-containing protein [Nocardia amamiensis]
MSVEIRVYAELNDFLRPDEQYAVLRRPFRPHQTVKDLIEAAGIPHTEVDLVLVNGQPVDFGHHPRVGDRVSAYPVFETLDIGAVTRVRPHPLREPRFVADVNLGGLAKLMRLMGLDVHCRWNAGDAELAEVSAAEHRILLTRDRGLLKRRNVTHGVYIRSDQPIDQIVEVVRRLDLRTFLAPFTRCLRCGGPVAEVAKTDVEDRLQPLTRRYYDTFRQCRDCGRVYWRGSHQARLSATVERIRAELGHV